jgi:hypothetical protein
MNPVRRLTLLGVLGGTLSGGCATVATGGGGSQKVKVTSDPPGATVLVDGKPFGVTPAAVPLNRKTDHQIEVSAPGYETAQVTVQPHVNPWLLGNIIFGGIPGLLVDVVTDSTHSLTPGDLKVQLRGTGAPPSKPVTLPTSPPESRPVN